MDADREIWVEVFEDGPRGKTTLEFVECRLTFGGPVEALAFLEKGGDRGDDTRISFNKAAVEVGETEEYLDFFDVGGSGPLIDGNDTIRVHGDALGRDDEAKE